jgi:hypothetical protein
MIHSSWSLGLAFSHPLNTPMINSKPAALPSCCASTRSQIAMIVYTVEVTLPATPPAVSSGKRASHSGPALYYLWQRRRQTTPPQIAPEGTLCPVDRWAAPRGGGSPVPPAVCVRASSHTWVGGHHHEETDRRVRVFVTSL